MFLPVRHGGIKLLKSLALNSKPPFRVVGLHCHPLPQRWKDGRFPGKCLSPLPCHRKPFPFIMRRTHGTLHSSALIRVYAVRYTVHCKKDSPVIPAPAFACRFRDIISWLKCMCLSTSYSSSNFHSKRRIQCFVKACGDL